MTSLPTKEEIISRISYHLNFPSPPQVALKLNSILKCDCVTCEEIEKIIKQDPLLTSKILKIVNSPFYGFPFKISSISKAVIILGINVIRTLALTIDVLERVQDSDVALWEHAVCCAMMTKLLSDKLGFKAKEETTTASLIQNIGKFFLRIEFPNESQLINKKIKQLMKPDFEVEEALLGINHAEIGYRLANSWNLPTILAKAIENHHKPHEAGEFKELTSLIHLSDVIICGYGITTRKDTFVPPLDIHVFEILKITIDDLFNILKELDFASDCICGKNLRDEFFLGISLDEESIRLKANTESLQSELTISLKRKLSYLKYRFSQVRHDPILLKLMKLIAKQIISREKRVCQTNLT